MDETMVAMSYSLKKKLSSDSIFRSSPHKMTRVSVRKLSFDWFRRVFWIWRDVPIRVGRSSEFGWGQTRYGFWQIMDSYSFSSVSSKHLRVRVNDKLSDLKLHTMILDASLHDCRSNSDLQSCRSKISTVMSQFLLNLQISNFKR